MAGARSQKRTIGANASTTKKSAGAKASPAPKKRTATKKTATKKTATKKTATKKTTAKQTTPEKATSKKTATKKTAKKAATKKTAKKSAPKRSSVKKTQSNSVAASSATGASNDTAARTRTLAAGQLAGSGSTTASRKTSVTAKQDKPKFLSDKKWLAARREELINERKRYTHNAEALAAEAAALMADREPGDVQFDEESGEGDTLAVERDRDLALSAQAREKVDEIDAALDRLDRGIYGQCIVGGAGDYIPQERLEALPMAPKCIAHQTSMF